MKRFFLLLFLFFMQFNFAQDNAIKNSKKINEIIQESIVQLENALIQKDTASLKQILHPDLTLGHSNGWTETKTSLLKSLPTSKVSYQEFKLLKKPEIILFKNEIASVRRWITAIGTYENQPFEVDLNVLEIWTKEENTWQLFARQSVEIKFDK